MAKKGAGITGLCSLPAELLLKITSYLQPPFRACFALTCKRLKDFVGPGTLKEHPGGVLGEMTKWRRGSGVCMAHSTSDDITIFLHLLKRDLATGEYILRFGTEELPSPCLLVLPLEQALLDITNQETTYDRPIEVIPGHTQCRDLGGSLHVGGALNRLFQTFRSAPVCRSPHCALATWLELRKGEKAHVMASRSAHHHDDRHLGEFNWSAGGDDSPKNLCRRYHSSWPRPALSKIKAYTSGDKLYRAYEYNNITASTLSVDQVEVELCKHRLICNSARDYDFLTTVEFNKPCIIRCDPCNLKCRIIFKTWTEQEHRWPVEIRNADIKVEIVQDLSSVH